MVTGWDSSGTLATAATTRGINWQVETWPALRHHNFRLRALRCEHRTKPFPLSTGQKLGGGGGSEAFPGAGPPFCFFGTTQYLVFGREGVGDRGIVFAFSPDPLPGTLFFFDAIHTIPIYDTQHATHVICLTSSLPLGFFFCVGGRLRPRLHRDTTLIPLSFQTFFYAQSYNNDDDAGSEVSERRQGVECTMVWLDGRFGGVGMGECDLDGSSRLVTTTPGLLRFFFGDILFSGTGMGGRDG